MDFLLLCGLPLLVVVGLYANTHSDKQKFHLLPMSYLLPMSTCLKTG
jgi:hypothetical protein